MSSVLSQVGNMGTRLAGLQQNFGLEALYSIIFQVVATRKHSDGTLETREIEVQPLTVLPNEVRYILPNRAKVTQTPSGAWKDSYGMGLTRVTLIGSFGQRERLVGGVLKTGYRRMIEFKERIMRWSNTTFPLTKAVTNYDDQLQTRLADWATLPDVVFYTNFYDFYQNEFFSIDMGNLQITESTQRNNLPTYTLTIMETGDTVKTKTKDPVLLSLLFIKDILTEIQTSMESIENIAAPFVGGIQIISTLSSGLISGISQTVPSVINLFTGAAFKQAAAPAVSSLVGSTRVLSSINGL